MTCQSIQNRVLLLPDPRQVPADLRTHLDACPACAAWWCRAARLETLLELLPAPPAPGDKKAALVGELIAAGTAVPGVSTGGRGPVPSAGVAAWRRAAGYAAALAAAVLVVAGGWRLATRPNAPKEVAAAPRHPLLDAVVKRDLALARADTPAKRLEVLGGLADDLSAETRGLARVATAEELNELSAWFGTVVRKGIVRQAADLERLPVHPIGRAERAAVYTRLAGQLDAAAREAAAAAREAPAGSQDALKRIADAARDGRQALATLATEGK